MTTSADDRRYMERALELARQGLGHVEPNPMVGCVLVRDGQIIGEGWHKRFGGPHAEIEALTAAGERARGATAYVTLEPCCHHGKTGPCTQALIAAAIARVVVGCEDPNPHPNLQVAARPSAPSSGPRGGLAELRSAGIQVETGLLAPAATDLVAPFAKLITTGRPWIIAKWAMSIDGRTATHTGDSKWISGEFSRDRVHQVRGRVDAVLVGRGTAEADDPLLTARPPGPRTATRIVLDSQARLSLKSQLVKTANQTPLIVAVSEAAPPERRQALEATGAEVLALSGNDRADRFAALLDELGRRQMTNLLVEGGAEVLGTLCDARMIDEVHVFIAPRIIGGQQATGPIGGAGIAKLHEWLGLRGVKFEMIGEDLFVSGRAQR